ncbi:NAD(P)-dependent oxidoreductase [Phytoactinopolyspora endophytica]|uniref:NAD(P)-dependent oxidoreductase n=1 Tax=Phytoactinopolyspora endophytica TaxID=1642495 RepID=UPI00101BAB4B|nr:NAD(P)-dependent oxidoreductase [Phytoactinopolyspora endophytica]
MNFDAEDLGLGNRPVAAIATLYRDDRLSALGFAQSRGVGHIGISAGPHEIAPEVATFMHQPGRAPIVLGTEWLVGATTIPVLQLASLFRRVEGIRIAAVLDDQDKGGPEQVADLERLTGASPLALERRDGIYSWLAAGDMQTTIHAVDGTRMEALAISPLDIVALGTETGAKNVRFDLAEGVSFTRRNGRAMSTEIIVEVTGADWADRPLRIRQAVIHPQGQMSRTGLGVAMVLERLAKRHFIIHGYRRMRSFAAGVGIFTASSGLASWHAKERAYDPEKVRRSTSAAVWTAMHFDEIEDILSAECSGDDVVEPEMS